MNSRATTGSRWNVVTYRKVLYVLMAIALGVAGAVVYNNANAPTTPAVVLLDPGTDEWFATERQAIAANEEDVRILTAQMGELYVQLPDGTWGVLPENADVWGELVVEYNEAYLAWYDRVTYYEQQALLAGKPVTMVQDRWTTLQPPGGRDGPLPNERWVIDPATLVNPL